jgi:protein-tyrosine-phosphatase
VIAEAQDIEGKILWVCRENIGRSQVAAAFCEREFPGIAASAGLNVTIDDKTGPTVGECAVAAQVIDYMEREEEIDMRPRKRTHIEVYTSEALLSAKAIIVLAEEQVTPSWLEDFPNAVAWPFRDLKHEDEERTQKIITRIQKFVHDIVPLFIQNSETPGLAEITKNVV